MPSILDSYNEGDKISLKGLLLESKNGTAKNGTKFARGIISVEGECINWIGFDRRYSPAQGSEVKLQGKVAVYKDEKQIQVTSMEDEFKLEGMSKAKKLLTYYRNCIEKEYQGSVIKVDLSNSPNLKQENEGLVESMRTSVVLNLDENSSDYIWYKKITLTGEETNVMLGYPILKKTYNDGTKKYAPLAFVDTNIKTEKGNVTITRVSDSISWNYGALEILGIPIEERDYLKERLTNVSDELSYDTERLASGILELENYSGLTFGWDDRVVVQKHSCGNELEIIYSREVCFDGQANSVYEYLLKDLGDLLNETEKNLEKGPLGVILSGQENIIDEKKLIIVTPLPSNNEQTIAITKALSSTLSCVTGPPGTGKSQFVANLASSALANNKTVLIASKNNQAVDVAIGRLRRAIPTSWPIRSGNRENRRIAASKLFDSINADHTHDTFANVYDKIIDVKYKMDSNHELIMNYDEVLQNLNLELTKRSETISMLEKELTNIEINEIETFKSELNDLRIQLLIPLNFFMKKKQINNRKIIILQKHEDFNSKYSFKIPKNIISEISFKYSKINMDILKPIYTYVEELETKYELLLIEKEKVNILIATIENIKSIDEIESENNNLEILFNDLSRELIKTSWDALVDSTSKLRYLEVLSLSLGSGFTSNLKSNVSDGLKVAPIWGVTNLSAWGNFPLKDGLFDLVIIDEASQCDIPSILPLLYRAKRAILVGDPNQLQHITSLKPMDSKMLSNNLQLGDLSKEGYNYTENSAFLSARRHTEVSSILKDHYRSHPAIAEFANRFVYKGELDILTDPNSYEDGDGVFWHDINGKAVGNNEGGSLKNLDEAKIVIKLLLELSGKMLTKSFGVVTPYKAQSELIADMISRNNAFNEMEIRVATAHKFQGDEKDIIIMSTVVSESSSIFKKEFANNLNLVNVAVTRARRQLHVVGSISVCTDMGGLLGSLANYSQSLQKFGFESPAEEYLYNAIDKSIYNVEIQKEIDGYRVDLLLSKSSSNLKLIVECDGHPFHRNIVKDKVRDEYLTSKGYSIIHVSAKDSLKNTKNVIKRINGIFDITKLEHTDYIRF